MSIYDDLQDKYSREWNAENEYWAELRKEAQEILVHFKSYLGVDDDASIVIDGQATPVLELGRIPFLGEFTACDSDELNKVDGLLKVLIRLNFKVGAEPEIYIRPVFDITLGVSEDGYQASTVIKHVKRIFNGPPYKDLFDHLIDSLKP